MFREHLCYSDWRSLLLGYLIDANGINSNVDSTRKCNFEGWNKR
jgi:hypothetical protein